MLKSGKLPFLLFLSISFYFAASLPAQSRELTVGVEDFKNWLPYSSYINGKYEGLGRDILDLFAKEKGYKFNYLVYPLKRRDHLYVAGKFDLAFPDNPQWVGNIKKGLKIKYGKMLSFTDGVLVLKKNRGKGVGGLKHLGIPLGFTPYQYLDRVNSKDIRLIPNPSYDSLQKQLLKGRLDGVYVNVKISEYYWRKSPLTKRGQIVFDPTLPHAKGYWSLSSFKHPEIITAFELFMKREKRAISALKEKYGF